MLSLPMKRRNDGIFIRCLSGDGDPPGLGMATSRHVAALVSSLPNRNGKIARHAIMDDIGDR